MRRAGRSEHQTWSGLRRRGCTRWQSAAEEEKGTQTEKKETPSLSLIRPSLFPLCVPLSLSLALPLSTLCRPRAARRLRLQQDVPAQTCRHRQSRERPACIRALSRTRGGKTATRNGKAALRLRQGKGAAAEAAAGRGGRGGRGQAGGGREEEGAGRTSGGQTAGGGGRGRRKDEGGGRRAANCALPGDGRRSRGGAAARERERERERERAENGRQGPRPKFKLSSGDTQAARAGMQSARKPEPEGWIGSSGPAAAHGARALAALCPCCPPPWRASWPLLASVRERSVSALCWALASSSFPLAHCSVCVCACVCDHSGRSSSREGERGAVGGWLSARNAMEAAVRNALQSSSRSLLLAVSGGVDSMALAHIVARLRPGTAAGTRL